LSRLGHKGAKFDLLRNVRTSLLTDEQKVIGSTPDVGMIPKQRHNKAPKACAGLPERL
jgi:hypothetical protein